MTSAPSFLRPPAGLSGRGLRAWARQVLGAALFRSSASGPGQYRPSILHLLGLAALLLLGMGGIVAMFFWRHYWIPAESMKPTLLIGDFVMVARVSAEEVQRGDVIVFRHPMNGSDMIKRLIGMPGDRVQMTDGRLILNGEAVPLEPAGVFEEVMEPQGPMRSRPRCANGAVEEGAICRKERFVEVLPGGVQHDVLNIVDAPGMPDTTGVYSVPEGYFFVMGDNRDNSADSRFDAMDGGLGFVPASNIIGRADRILFSSAGQQMWHVWTWRSDRYFKAIE